MSRCACAQATCQCVLMDSATIDFSGAGSAGVPYTGDVIPTGVAPLLISADAGNELTLGTDGLLKSRGGRTLYSSGVAVPDAPPGPTTLASVVIPANTLAATGYRLKWRAEFALSAFLFDFFSIRINYGGFLLIEKPLNSNFDGTAVFEGDIIRTAALNQKAASSALLSFPGGAFGTFATQVDARNEMVSPGLNNAVANNFDVIAESAGLASEVTMHSLTIDLFPL